MTGRWHVDTYDDHGQDIADTADLPLQTVKESPWLLGGLLLAFIVVTYAVVLFLGPGL